VAIAKHPSVSVLKPWSGDTQEFDALTEQQKIAVEALLASPDYDMTEACRQAGYKNPAASAAQMWKSPLVRKLVARRSQQRMAPFQLEQPRVLLELMRVSFLDPRKIIDPATGQLLHLKDMDADTAAAIASIKVTKRVISRAKEDDPEGVDEDEQTTEVRFVPKLGGLEMLAKHVGILKELAPQMNVNILNGDFWDGLAKQVSAANEDAVERKLAEAKVEAIERDTSKEEVVDAKKI
jgi:Terminase small subunit